MTKVCRVQTERLHSNLISEFNFNGSVMNMHVAEKVRLIPMCCVCHRVRDDRQNNERPRDGVEQWRSLRSFLRLYRIAQQAYQLTHTYCARCMEQQMGQILETRSGRSERQPDLIRSKRAG